MLHLVDRVAAEVIGRREEIQTLLAILSCGRHVLLEGPPGTSKTTIIRAVARAAGLPLHMITGHMDLTASKLIGYFDPAHVLARGYLPEFFEYGPLTRAMKEGAVLYVEEFNRMPDETTNVFVTVTSEGELAIPRLGVVRAEDGFRIIAAMNPLDDTGTNRISRALKDRFCSLRLDYQSREEECSIVRLRTGLDNEELISLAVDIARATRVHPEVRLGVSVRGAIDMALIASQLLNKSGQAETELIIERAAIAAMRDKLWLADPNKVTPEEVIREIIGGLRGTDRKKER